MPRATTAPAPASAATPAPRQENPPVSIRELTPEQVRAELWPRPSPVFAPMAIEERTELGALVAALARAAIAGGDVRALAARAAGIGFGIEIWRVRGRVFWALRELPDRRRGAGAYVLRPGPHPGAQPEIVLQAPHAYFDRGTGNLAAALFFGHEGSGRARALFTNTAHRRGGGSAAPGEPGAPSEPGEPSEPDGQVDDDAPDATGPADVAHSAEHGFQAATEQIARVLDRVVVIQLHGFAERPGKPEIILSSGADRADALLAGLQASLGAVFERVLRYPDEIDELGGTTNVQGRMLARYPRAHFVHVELSARTRRRLGASPALLARFAHALLSLDAR
jgi:hypothetical protein